MSHNLAKLSKEERDRISIDLLASGAVYKEQVGTIPAAEQAASEVEPEMKPYFLERVKFYRSVKVSY